MMQQLVAREGFSRTGSILDGNSGDGAPTDGKSPPHVEGCSCAGCMSLHGGDKDYQPGDGSLASEDTISGSTSTTATLTPGSYVSSAIDTAGDSDWFRINLTAGQTYTFATYLPGGGLSDSILTLRDSTGALVTTNDDANTAQSLYYSEIIFTATTTGSYFLDVTGYSTATGDYYISSSRPLNDAVGTPRARPGA